MERTRSELTAFGETVVFLDFSMNCRTHAKPAK